MMREKKNIFEQKTIPSGHLNVSLDNTACGLIV